MFTFLFSIIILIVGYFVYGKIIDKVFDMNESSATPAITMNDGVDFVPMSWWRIFLIQFLNIAGLGPIFGAIAGAMWGPVAFLWIVVGGLFAGAVHDYFSGMLSLREKGNSIPEIIGHYLGNNTKQFIRGFTVILLLLVGTVFIMGPAKILNSLTGDTVTYIEWVIIVFIYYFLATILPIDKLIGRIYPFFGAALLFMALGITYGLLFEGYHIPELTFNTIKNYHVDSGSFPIFPMLFISIACGAISGFHATQSPIMSRLYYK